LSIYQIIDKLDEKRCIASLDYLFAALKEETSIIRLFLKSKIMIARTQPLEGYFFPDTYEFYINENANSVIRRFLSNFNKLNGQPLIQMRADQIGINN